MKYQHTKEMDEISGFGGGYEAACQTMLNAGCEWLETNPNSDPQYHGYKNIYGVIHEDNDDAKALTKVVLEACDDCTGAMMQAVIRRLLYIKENGWDKYVAELIKKRSQKS